MKVTIALRRRGLLHALLWLALLPFAAGGAFAQSTPRSFEHIQTGFALTGQHANARCESCHLNGVFKGTPRDCASCHTAGARWSRGNVVKPPVHVPTPQPCDACHTTQSYAGARFTHVGVATGSCTTCHNGALASGKPPAHVATSASCDSCHRSAAWLPATGFNHAGVAPGSCASCHNGGRATGRGPRHIPYQTLAGSATLSCDACHRAGTTSWTPARFHATTSVSTQCAGCHTGGYPPAVGKPATPIHAAATVCENCHRSTSDWAAAKVDHATLTAATSCTGCHNGSAATGKNAQHIPTTANCTGCHSTATWRPSTFNHTQVPVTNQCSTCHNGAYPPADGRPPAHVPYQALTGVAITNCDSCHKAGTTSWTPAKFHATVSVATQCASCHTGSYPPAVGKPPTALHAGVTVCESCHRSSASWTAVSFAHSAANAVGTGTCDTCHNGTTATGKPAGHVPVTTGAAKCDTCHRSQASWSAATTMNHGAVATTTCKTCHNGSYVSQGTTGALAKPANHIPEQTQLLNGAAMDCNACHTGTSSWTTLRMNHNGSQGGGSGWCKGCHLRGTGYAGSMERATMTHKSKTPPAVDCSESGCHRPLGSKGSTYNNWD